MSRKLKDELSVWGWIRENCTNYHLIPVELLQLCLEMYFLQMDSWSKTLSSPVFIIDDHTLKVSTNADGYPNAFGDLVLSKGDIMEWKLKTPVLDGWTTAIIVGIMEAGHARSDMDYLHDFCCVMCSGEPGMGFYTCTGCTYSDKRSFTDNDYINTALISGHDIIIMRLDMTGLTGTLSFKTGNIKNGDEDIIDHGVAFNAIDVNKEYRMAVSMWSPKDFVEIIS